MAGEQSHKMSRYGKDLFLTAVMNGLIDLVPYAVEDGNQIMGTTKDGKRVQVRVRVKSSYEFPLFDKVLRATGLNQIDADALAEKPDFILIFIDYETGVIAGDFFSKLRTAQEHESVQWPVHYNAGGRQLELYWLHDIRRFAPISIEEQSVLINMAILNKKKDKNQVDLF